MPRVTAEDRQSIRAKMPVTFAAHREMGRALLTEGALGIRLKEMVRLRSAQLARCNH